MTEVSQLDAVTASNSDQTTLARVVRVRGNFHRSANIEKDIGSDAQRRSYVLNHVAHHHALGILRDIVAPNGPKAWAVTGPFGSGKSSFVTFLADLLAHPDEVSPEYRSLSQEVGFENRRYRVIPIVGQRGSITSHIAKALGDSEDLSFSLELSLNRNVDRAAAEGFDGIFVILDEFNRVLEYEARHPGESHIGALQTLAEWASRSDGKLLLMTVQHMSFADYVGSGITRSAADEWRKIQGRFRDIPFYLSHAQSLELMAKAIDVALPATNSLSEQHEKRVERLFSSSVMKQDALRSSLEQTWPIHPLAAVIATDLFRGKLAQNERSMFAFLTSEEPAGFQSYLESQPLDDSPDLFDLSRLFDYVLYTVGAAVFVGVDAREWAQARQHLESASERFSETHINLVKAIFLLNRYGAPVGVYATRMTLALAHDNKPFTVIDAAINELIEARVLRERRYRGDIALTSGSDYDLQKELEKARLQVSAQPVSERLASMPSAVASRTARRHYVRTGNLRTCSITIAESIENAYGTESRHDEQDLDICFILPDQASGDDQLLLDATAVLQNSRSLGKGPRICAIVKSPEVIRAITIDTAAATWLLNHDEGLKADDVARSEVRSYREEAEARALALVGPIFGWAGHRLDPTLCYWVTEEGEASPETAAGVHQLIDGVLTRSYSSAPEFHNELINRNVPSSAAARARRELITAMVTHEHEERLGLTGYPPQATIYDTLLLKEGFHRNSAEGHWSFTRPEQSWGHAWDAIDRLVAETEERPIGLNSIRDMLLKPPFGLKRGPIPILIAAYLVAKKNVVSLFEDGTYVALLRPEVFERMLRSFDGFSIRSLPTDGVQSHTLDVLQQVLVRQSQGSSSNASHKLVETVRSILSTVTALPQFSRRTKQFLDHPAAISVREMVLRSQDPQQLLLHDLPGALGFASLSTREEQEMYARQLRASLVSLQTAYERMLGYIGSTTREFIGFEEADAENGVLLNRMMPPLGKRPPGPVGQLVAALSMTAGDWRENVGRAVLDGKPTQQWDDRDVVGFEVRMRQLAATLLELEALIGLQHQEHGGATVAAVSLIDGSGRFSHVRRTISIDSAECPMVNDAAIGMVKLLRSRHLSESGAYAALAEAMALLKQDMLEDRIEKRGAD